MSASLEIGPIYIGINNRFGTRLKDYKGNWNRKGTITIVIEIDDPNDYGFVLSQLKQAENAKKSAPRKGGDA